MIRKHSWILAASVIAAGCSGNVGTGNNDDATTMAQIADKVAAFQMDAAKKHRPTVIPLIECIDNLGNGKFRAHFGYNNPSTKVIHADAGGDANFFFPGSPDRDQPDEFEPGIHHDVFTVDFKRPIVWLLQQDFAVATSASPLCGPQQMCPPSCDDNNPCTIDSCDATTNFQCVHTPSPDGTTCGNATVCDGAETCKGGMCQPGTPVSCDDNNPCTADSCDPVKGCVHTPVTDGTSCPAVGACNTAGMCKAGSCQPGPGKDCNDNNPCTADMCDPNSGNCTHVPVSDGTSCSDGNACNGLETCQKGACAPGTPPNCTSTNPCEVGSCDPTNGCILTPVADGTTCTSTVGCGSTAACKGGACTVTNGPNCDDGNPCTADSCGANGVCVHTPVTDGTTCSDGNLCNGAETCQAGQCHAGTPVTCTASDQCHVAGTCDPKTGTCSNPPAPNGQTCNDGNACTNPDSCNSGVCVGGPAKVCTASDQCHSAGTCDPASGTCSNPPVTDGTTCSDGNACNGAEQCKGGVCTSVTPLVCTDSNPCHATSCDPATGCKVSNVPDGTVCAAANGCHSQSTCVAGTCTAGPDGSCDDGNPCTADACGPNGQCVHTPVANGTSCSDGNACNGLETCQAGSCTPGTPVVCKAADQCHVAGTCDPATGACSNPNATDGTACNDGNNCDSNDVCKGGVCSGTPVVCTASDQCHAAGSCDPSTGKCSNPPVADGTSCNDGNSCDTNDVCKAGVCSGTPVTCTASDQCHAAGTCDPSTGKCSNPAVADGTSCNDGNLCDKNDVCKAGVCTGTPTTCTASDQCHAAGTCDPAKGACSNPPVADGTACNDGNKCNQNEACKAGVCAGTPVVCTASDQCHVAGTCDPTTGTCSNPNATDGTACSDGNKCNQNEACKAGVCAGTPVVCTASDQCHVAGTCDPTSGKCSNPNAADGTACNDGNLCDQNDVCKGGVCAGTPLVCKTDSGCTPGVCNPATGVCSPETNCPPPCAKAVWAKGYDTPLLGSTALDPSGALYVTGGIAGSIDFGKGPITTNGSSDVYLVKIDPATGLATWSFNYGDPQDQAGVAIAADKMNHVVVTGTYIGALAFGGTAAALNAASDSIFLAGFDSVAGGGLWAKDINLGGGALLGVAVDPTDNNAVVVGFTGAGAAANFGGGALTNGGGKDVVVAKFNSATGALVWAKEFGGTGDQLANAIAVDATGRVFITGQYSGVLDFGFGTPLPTASAASKRIFVARLDGATGAGQASAAFGTSGQQQSVAIAVDGNDNVIVGGSITGGTVNFGTGPLVSAGAQDAFVAELTPNLTGIWAKRFGDAATQNTKSVAVDGSNNVIVAGLFQGVIDASPAATLTSAGGFDAFVMTLDGATGAPKCAASAGDAADQTAAHVSVDAASGSQYVLGTFISSITWDTLPAISGSPTSSQTFVVKRK
jgi:hypothetical protein